ncbi:hypothetical protein NBRC116583_20080 [Arenicella sp. 4NH20-0111]|uniref:hypothetical protein n=1 Tax=Arenicella sp. 4NH20-0111 TaxID=3127648 RepID=UPI003109361F
MANESSKDLSAKHQKWEQESAKIRKVQISLDFPDAADILLRTLAAREHKAPSSMIREILGMPSSPPKRARIGVSFNDEELEQLGRRYDVDPNDKAEIRRQLTQEVTSVLSTAQTLDDSNAVEVDNGSLDEKLNVGAMKDLQAVSDGIHEKFQLALASRDQDIDE